MRKELKMYGLMLMVGASMVHNVGALALDSSNGAVSQDVKEQYTQDTEGSMQGNGYLSSVEFISNAINDAIEQGMYEKQMADRVACKIEDNKELDRQIQQAIAEEEERKRKEAERKAAEEEARHWRTDTFRLTAYCNCSICCGQWADGLTATMTSCCEGTTIAVDPNIIPLGSRVIIDGHEYIAQDTGSAIKGNRIDIYISDHSRASDFGVKYRTVKYRID